MSINDELSDFFTDVQSVIDDDFRFKKKLAIGDDHFSYLRNAKNLSDVAESLLGGVGAGGIAATAYYTTLGLGGKILFAVGLGSNPVGWVAAGAAALGASGFYGYKKVKGTFFKKAEDELVTKVPKYLNTPIDLLGLSVATLVLPVSIKMAQADGNFCHMERSQILKYFIDEWGYNSEFIEALMQAQESQMSDFSYKSYAETLKLVCNKTSEFKLCQVSDEILNFQREIILMDGEIHPDEVKELATLKLYLDA
jgi:uncharacterized tellurite resistance protein B-like protein